MKLLRIITHKELRILLFLSLFSNCQYDVFGGGTVSCAAPDGCPTNTQCFSPPCPPPPTPPPPPCPCDVIKSAITGCDATCVPDNPFCQFLKGTCSNGGGQTFAPTSANSKIIERTFLKKKPKKAQSKKAMDPCVFPAIDLTIEKNDMLALMEVGSKRVSLTLDTSITMINVGMASEDTQFWTIPFLDYNTIGITESVQPDSSPFVSSFPGANRVFKSQIFGGARAVYSHFDVNDNDVTLQGNGHISPSDTFDYQSFETEVDFPIQCGVTVDAITTTQFGFSNDIDSVVETKNLVVRATGMLTPIDEKPVRALLSYHDYTSKVYFNGMVTDSTSYSAFTWFSEVGHRVIGILKPGSPTEGNAEFVSVVYEKTIPVCPTSQDLGTAVDADTYKAQNDLSSSSYIINGPVQFVAGQEINLNSGFTVDTTFTALIDSDPCNVN